MFQNRRVLLLKMKKVNLNILYNAFEYMTDELLINLEKETQKRKISIEELIIEILENYFKNIGSYNGNSNI